MGDRRDRDYCTRNYNCDSQRLRKPHERMDLEIDERDFSRPIGLFLPERAESIIQGAKLIGRGDEITIGEVTDSGLIEIYHRGRSTGDIFLAANSLQNPEDKDR
jgi:hypothetical protein